MKTKEEILKHLQEVGYSSKQRVKISAYLLGKGIEIDTKDIKKGDNKFEDFLEGLKCGEILFNSKESAQRAIDCLGVDLIKKALTFKNK